MTDWPHSLGPVVKEGCLVEEGHLPCGSQEGSKEQEEGAEVSMSPLKT
jgi:hypothetical protein